LLSDFGELLLLIPMVYTLGKQYNIDNAAVIGACFIPNGLGSMIGAPLAGRISDKTVLKWREKRNGIWYPEDRLRATASGAFFFIPLSVLLFGIFSKYIPGPIGLTLSLICLFMNGLGVDIVLSPSAAYAVDIMHDRSAEAMAAISGFRAFLLSLVVSMIIPSIETIGLVATNTIAALIGWLAAFIIWLTIRYGAQMRAYVDIGYSTAEIN